jgi:hypothetical protein
MSKSKIFQIILFAAVASFALFINVYVNQGYCVDNCSVDLMRAIINPVSVGSPILAVVLFSLLFFPTDLFRRWSWYLGGPFLLITIWNISTIPTRGGSIISPTRVGMAELLMQILAGFTVLFIVGYYGLQWYKNRSK